MAATTKAGLLEITRKEYDKLAGLLAGITVEQAMRKVDGVSFKDVIGHRAHWITLFLGWYSDGRAGRPVFFPAQGYKWNDLKRYNADLREQQANLDWAGSKTLLENNFNALVAFIEKASEDELYGAPMQGANNNWTPGRWAEAAGPSHFRSAAKYIRTALRAAL